jgi:riboflavin kinase/FMN adenylyltransferase
MPLRTMLSAEEWVEQLGPSRKRAVVTIGNFDGVHRGHQKILQGVVQRAKESDSLAAVLTFYPHPARVLRPDAAPDLLRTLQQRLSAFRAAGITAALVVCFDAKLATLSAEDFVRRFLVETMRARDVLVGANFRFGHRQSGDVGLLTELGKQCGFEVEVIPPLIEGGIVVSSTAIRQAVREGRMEDAQKLLGRPFALEGEIRSGTGQGRKLVVPTLNLVTEQEIVPLMGVYATESSVGGKMYRSVTNVGVRPTFDGAQLAIESHLFDFDENLTSGGMDVHFFTRLRDEQKFPGPEELREQVLKDIERAKEYFASESQRS